MYKLFLGFRYFRSRLINIIPIICMMLGVMALIVILAVMDGFQAQLRATLRGSLSDLIINVRYESNFEEWEKILAETEGVRSWSPHLQTGAVLNRVELEGEPGANRSFYRMQFAAILGVDAARESEVSAFKEYLRVRRPGEPPETWKYSALDPAKPFEVRDERAQAMIFTDESQAERDYALEKRSGIIVGRPLARLLNLNPPLPVMENGEVEHYHYSRVCLTTAIEARDASGGETFSTQQIYCPVTAIYESGNQEIDMHISYMDRAVARRLFHITRDPEEIRVQLDDYDRDKERVQEDLYSRRGEIFRRTNANPMQRYQAEDWPFSIQTWEDRRRNFLNAINNEKGLIAIIAGMAFIVTGFMIFSILSMIVTMKTRDIGIIKALGGTTKGVLAIFIFNGLLVGVIGASLGLAGGLFFVDNINEIKEQLNAMFGWEPFPQNIYLFSEIPTHVIPGEVAMVTGMALLVALLGAFLPALRASRLDPVESLRYE